MDKLCADPHISPMPYHPPLDDMILSLRAGAGLEAACRQGMLGAFEADLIEPVLTEAGRVAADILAPLNVVGDREGARLEGERVITAPGWRAAYEGWRAGGWNGLSAPEAFGGQSLPFALNAPCLEMWSAANLSFSLAPMLTLGAIDAIASHGSDVLQQIYLPKLVSGEWTGTMLLTEPQAGSDVGALRTLAQPQDDGTYRLRGTKIFITYGEHDLADNIVHLVLARLPNAPAGTRGISLFLVPKYLPGPDGRPGARNDIRATGLEHKLGIHGSPTCVMSLGDGGGAVGFLVGEANRGMACMFTMMNQARLGVGLEGVGLAERACQKALAYARDRRQGRAAQASGHEPSAIIAHPDVQRMLMNMHALTAAARTICYATAVAADIAKQAPSADVAARAAGRTALLTPIAKAFSTDIANEVTSLGVQVHGGMGYIEETGAAQLLRDARITAIYEGTNGIQAIDLLTRKVLADDGAALDALLADLRAIAAGAGNGSLGRTAQQVARGLDLVDRSKIELIAMAKTSINDALAGATPFLRLAALATGSALLLANAVAAEANGQSMLATRHAALASFFGDHLLPESAALAESISCGDGLAAAAASVLMLTP